ncbi:DUF4832 domain-containing protein [Photobacterium phosphoreum]|uniref:DUF4832 domain-containing protein n=1 Tax=Photobacterium phosphoreum TaxID=659 RepID=UPI001E2EFC29|nr:DUF4832 domain-containing protein [Photobacterium phosphoreum]MCD9518225.1 DUF4832 domain-containing protein [Photobacterium phosphoreum]
MLLSAFLLSTVMHNNHPSVILPKHPIITEQKQKNNFRIQPHNTSINNQVLNPHPINDILVNPDIGLTDFYTIDSHDDLYNPIKSYPQTSVVYYRWYWEQLEPEQGVYDFGIIEKTLAQAIAHHKKLVFRIMTLSGKGEYYQLSDNHNIILGIPCWLKKQLINVNNDYAQESCSRSDKFIPNYNDPYFKQQITKLMMALGKKFDGNPNLLRIDTGLVGTWGEWNLSERTNAKISNIPDLTDQGYTEKDLQFYINLVARAFPHTQKTTLMASAHEDFMSYATSHFHMGWRADCLGDWNQSGWNHMENGYPDAIAHAMGKNEIVNHNVDHAFSQRWKKAPVDFELCNTLNTWSKQTWLYTYDKIQDTFNYALEQHASLINARSSMIPTQYQPIIDNLLRKLGYRFELQQLTTQQSVYQGDMLLLKSQWANTGVAPSYNNYSLKWRLRSSSGAIVATFNTNTNIRKWLPANVLGGTPPTYHVENKVHISGNIAADFYFLDVGLVSPKTNNAVVKLGIEGKLDDNWYNITTITILKKQ